MESKTTLAAARDAQSDFATGRFCGASLSHGETTFAVRFDSMPFVGDCWQLQEYVRGIHIGQPAVYASRDAAVRAMRRKIRNLSL